MPLRGDECSSIFGQRDISAAEIGRERTALYVYESC